MGERTWWQEREAAADHITPARQEAERDLCWRPPPPLYSSVLDPTPHYGATHIQVFPALQNLPGHIFLDTLRGVFPW